jgi:hypothetical protein
MSRALPIALAAAVVLALFTAATQAGCSGMVLVSFDGGAGDPDATAAHDATHGGDDATLAYDGPGDDASLLDGAEPPFPWQDAGFPHDASFGDAWYPQDASFLDGGAWFDARFDDASFPYDASWEDGATMCFDAGWCVLTYP